MLRPEIYQLNEEDGSVTIYDCGMGAVCSDADAAAELLEYMAEHPDVSEISDFLSARPEKYS